MSEAAAQCIYVYICINYTHIYVCKLICYYLSPGGKANKPIMAQWKLMSSVWSKENIVTWLEAMSNILGLVLIINNFMYTMDKY